MTPVISRQSLLSLLACAGIFISPLSLQAEDLNAIFTKVNQLIAEKNYPKAMEELTWARKEIEKLHQTRLSELLPTAVGAFQGGETQYQSALGLTNVERIYKSGAQEIKLTITGSGGGGEGLGGLAGIAKMGLMFGGAQPGVEQFRVDGVTASLNKNNGSPEVTVFLDGGSIVTLSSQSEVDAAALKKFAEGFKYTEIDSYLRGAK